MSAINLSLSALGFSPAIIVEWHDQVRRYVRASSDATIDDEEFTAVPELDFDIPPIGAGVEQEPAKVVVPADLDPFDKMATQVFSEVTVTIVEATFSNFSLVPRVVFRGIVGKTKMHHKNKSKLTEVTLLSRKDWLKDVSLGLKATDRCPLIFGDHVCGATVASVSATVSNASNGVEGTTLRFSSLPGDTAGAGQGRYTRGYVLSDGLRILVRQHHFGDLRMTTAKAPPQVEGYTWQGRTVTVFEGCTKDIPSCTFHGRQERFLGLGRVMPKYNPIIEDRPE